VRPDLRKKTRTTHYVPMIDAGCSHYYGAMLAALLPGVRDFRTPLATGYLVLLDIWLLWGRGLIPETPTNEFARRLADLSSLMGSTVTLAAVSFAAYLVGAVLTISRVPYLPELSSKHRVMIRVGKRIKLYVVLKAALRDPFYSDPILLWVLKESWGGVLKHALPQGKGSEAASEEAMPTVKVGESDSNTQDSGATTLSWKDDRDLWPVAVDRIAIQVHRELADLATKLQLEVPEIYDDYDRLRSEAEMRFSSFWPLLVLTGISVYLWTSWALIVIVIPVTLLLDGIHRQRRAERKVWQALITGKLRSTVLTELGDNFIYALLTPHSDARLETLYSGQPSRLRP
jgi:hypothetical protein